MNKKFRIGIVGGVGHIGLPLSLILAKKFKVTIIDPSKKKELVKKKKPPFKDNGMQKYLNDVVVQANLDFIDTLEDTTLKYDAIIITLGTPIDEWGNANHKDLLEIIYKSSKFLTNKKILILRSTINPGFSTKISKILKNVNLFYCPERIVQGKSFTEMFQIPQIIGCDSKTKKYFSIVKKIFYFSPLFIKTSLIEAELIKLFNNFYRYCSFAISNQMYLISNDYNVSFSKILKNMKYNYPRALNLAGAGFAAGPCLYKDTYQLASTYFGDFSLGNAAIEINEKRLVQKTCEIAIQNSHFKRIIILGASFKANCDDHRSSLSFKILKILKINTDKTILLYDPLVKHPKVSCSFSPNFKKDYFILATKHRIFNNLIKKIPKNSLLNIWDS